MCDSGDFAIGTVDGIPTTPAANKYMYMVTGAATDANYTAGKLLIELFGYVQEYIMAIRTANNQSLTEITAFPSAVALGGLVLLATATASRSSTVEFDSNIDSKIIKPYYKFIKKVNIKKIDKYNYNSLIDYYINVALN